MHLPMPAVTTERASGSRTHPDIGMGALAPQKDTGAQPSGSQHEPSGEMPPTRFPGIGQRQVPAPKASQPTPVTIKPAAPAAISNGPAALPPRHRISVTRLVGGVPEKNVRTIPVAAITPQPRRRLDRQGADIATPATARPAATQLHRFKPIRPPVRQVGSRRCGMAEYPRKPASTRTAEAAAKTGRATASAASRFRVLVIQESFHADPPAHRQMSVSGSRRCDARVASSFRIRQSVALR